MIKDDFLAIFTRCTADPRSCSPRIIPAIIAQVSPTPIRMHDVKLHTVLMMPKAPTAVADNAVAIRIWLSTVLRSIVEAEPTADEEPVARMSRRSLSRIPLNENLKMIFFFVKCSSMMMSAIK